MWVPDWGVAQTGGCQGYRSCRGWGQWGALGFGGTWTRGDGIWGFPQPGGPRIQAIPWPGVPGFGGALVGCTEIQGVP